MTDSSTPGGAPRPLPALDDPVAGPFWLAARERRLELPTCTACGFVNWPAATWCPRCLSRSVEWREVSGRARLWSWAVYETALHPAFATEVPYIVAGVELDEGAYLTTNILGADPAGLSVGASLEVVFREVADGVVLPCFRLSGSEEDPAGS
ncbi:OB-fold domain-containing protein [Streptomyces sp. NPDC051985]|uniref:Zn-ribbon domain-containing OB-fold protein n=1 Tax=Streptomyces sp. NPDC051985 TaxID=3155807 RepID=UPI0034314D12